MRIADAVHMPQFKWKAGECNALSTIPKALADRTCPVFKITPGGAFDAVEQRVLSTVEQIRLFGRRLCQARGRRLAFIDAELIDGERHSQGLTHHPLTELLERARLEGGLAAPVLTPRSSENYRAAVKRYRQSNPEGLLCLRLKLEGLESIESLEELVNFLKSVEATPDNAVLLIDGGPLYVGDAEMLAHLLAAQVARLAPVGTWQRVFWGATTFPFRPKLKPGETGRYARRDWDLFQKMFELREEFSTLPMFSDYGLEFPGDYLPIRVPPTAHLRYSTDREYLIFKGTTTKKPHGYEAIFPVASRLVSSEAYCGPDFSEGDRYIKGLTASSARTGNASIWRWAATDHHLRLVQASLAKLLGLPEVVEVAVARDEQLLLV